MSAKGTKCNFYKKTTSLPGIISYKLSVAYVIAKLSADSILDNNWTTLTVCGKCHVVHDPVI